MESLRPSTRRFAPAQDEAIFFAPSIFFQSVSTWGLMPSNG
jgi:hypothetical protein